MKKVVEKEKIHEGSIYTWIELKDGKVESRECNYELIKLWGY